MLFCRRKCHTYQYPGVDEQFDLLIVTGGGTLHPRHYVEPHNAELQPHRDALEEQLIMYCVQNEIPVIGVCRGMQHINALFGGKISYSARFKVPRPRGTDHMARIVKTDRYIKVNNFHSDCVYLENLSTMFYPIVVDEENESVEAFVSPTMSILAFQWHPERIFESEEGRLFPTENSVLPFLPAGSGPDVWSQLSVLFHSECIPVLLSQVLLRSTAQWYQKTFYLSGLR